MLAGESYGRAERRRAGHERQRSGVWIRLALLQAKKADVTYQAQEYGQRRPMVRNHRSIICQPVLLSRWVLKSCPTTGRLCTVTLDALVQKAASPSAYSEGQSASFSPNCTSTGPVTMPT